jgi:hypothetical protein
MVGSTTYKAGAALLLVELGPMLGYIVGSGGPGPERLTAHGYNELDQIPLGTLTKILFTDLL